MEVTATLRDLSLQCGSASHHAKIILHQVGLVKLTFVQHRTHALDPDGMKACGKAFGLNLEHLPSSTVARNTIPYKTSCHYIFTSEFQTQGHPSQSNLQYQIFIPGRGSSLLQSKLHQTTHRCLLPPPH
jgi:hypothetical protein